MSSISGRSGGRTAGLLTCLATTSETSINNESLMAIIARYVADKVENMLLRCSKYTDSHISENIADETHSN